MYDVFTLSYLSPCGEWKTYMATDTPEAREEIFSTVTKLVLAGVEDFSVVRETPDGVKKDETLAIGLAITLILLSEPRWAS